MKETDELDEKGAGSTAFEEEVSDIKAGDVTPTFTIECFGCGEEETIQAVMAKDAADKFNALGWQAIDGDITCPACQR